MKPDQLRASILKASSPKPIRLEVDGIGPVFVRVQTAFDSDLNRKKLEAAKKDDNCEIGRLLACMLCDEEGNQLFEITDDAAVMALAKLPGEAQMKLLETSNKVNKADPEKP